jgi:translation initiation factor 2B subunit (eIF-2B alpha/beta/delta family)
VEAFSGQGALSAAMEDRGFCGCGAWRRVTVKCERTLTAYVRQTFEIARDSRQNMLTCDGFVRFIIQILKVKRGPTLKNAMQGISFQIQS